MSLERMKEAAYQLREAGICAGWKAGFIKEYSALDELRRLKKLAEEAAYQAKLLNHCLDLAIGARESIPRFMKPCWEKLKPRKADRITLRFRGDSLASIEVLAKPEWLHITNREMYPATLTSQAFCYLSFRAQPHVPGTYTLLVCGHSAEGKIEQAFDLVVEGKKAEVLPEDTVKAPDLIPTEYPVTTALYLPAGLELDLMGV